jgi:hypothetical protein
MEHAMHRRTLQLPRRPDETCWRYRIRCFRIYAQWLRDTNGLTIFQKCLRKIGAWGGHVARLPATRIVRCAIEIRMAALAIRDKSGWGGKDTDEAMPSEGGKTSWKIVLEAVEPDMGHNSCHAH